MPQQTRLQGFIDVAATAVGEGIATIEGVHTAIARKAFSVLRLAPAVGPVAEVVRVVHDGITALVYADLGNAVAVSGAAAFPSVTNSATVAYAGDTNSRNNTALRPTTVRR
jgi:hypothetical protein